MDSAVAPHSPWPSLCASQYSLLAAPTVGGLGGLCPGLQGCNGGQNPASGSRLCSAVTSCASTGQNYAAELHRREGRRDKGGQTHLTAFRPAGYVASPRAALPFLGSRKHLRGG